MTSKERTPRAFEIQICEDKKMDDPTEIKKAEGARLMEIRAALDMSRVEFAAALGIGQSTLSNAERGRYRIGARRLMLAEQLFARNNYQSTIPTAIEIQEASSTPQPPKPATTVTTELVKEVLATAEEEPIQRAATALAEALGVTERDALSQIVAAKLRG